MSTEYEITTSELDTLVKIGEGLEGVLGSRMMGGGFGGCTINLVRTDTLSASIKSLLLQYKEQTGINAEYYPLAIDDGVKVFE